MSTSLADAPFAAQTPAPDPVLEVRDLQTHFPTNLGTVRAVDGVSFTVGRGETLGIVGESGSGKSMTALSVMRLLEAPGRVAGGSIRFQGRDVLRMNPAEMRALRGNQVAMVFQDPMTSLNPVLRIARQLQEAMVVHGRSAAEAGRRSVALLRRMGFTAPERTVRSFPHQLSGGMRQRVVLAMGMSNEPALLLADEPTTALDVTIQAQILELMRELNAEFGTAIVLISHDLGVIAGLCERVVVMYAGEIVEEGPTEQVLADPRHPYTWALMNAVPRLDSALGSRRLTTIEGMPPNPLAQPGGCRFAPRCPFRQPVCDAHPDLVPMGPGRASRCWVAAEGAHFPAQTAPATVAEAAPRLQTAEPPLLVATDLVKHFPVPGGGWFGRKRVVHAVDGISLSVRRGEVLGVVGESGCGKSTLGRTLLRLYKPDAGSISFDGQAIAQATQSAIRPLRRRMQMVFQDPYGSLNPRMTVGDTLAEPLRFHDLGGAAGPTARVAALLDIVGLPTTAAGRYPHEFSGGQRQRVAIARALAFEPDFIVADEPISALDVNIQAQIINLMVDLQERLGLTYLFIAHDLSVVRHISDRVLVLHLGKVAEMGPAGDLFAHPLHPYTRYLIAAIPVPDVAAERRRTRLVLQGEPASAIAPPSGCRFHTRCPLAQPICAAVEPPVLEHRPGHLAACHFPG
ncbi:MAG: dipeptide ABC transporter ATP-binding protein [Acetobacteraceae bacterium]|nr:dipeptide ABC transporter ATP-binding protein [Acetobacteraceae bacterium]